ncbi:MAG: hypothetical protein HY721_34085 [Planctomycetes bacterium]|nr:hypothetical protein [Planctomycetota bacterium]
MTPEDLGKLLHDKATRGAPLTSEESALLAEWYRQQDAAETQSLTRAQDDSAVVALRAQLSQTLDQLKTAAQEIQALANGNEKLREEIAALRERVARRLGPQPA